MELFSWGANSHGQLGQGHTEDTWKPNKVDTSMTKVVKSVVGGGGHTALVTDKGHIFFCGLNDQGQLGDPSEENKPISLMRHLPGLVVQKVACGWDFTIAIGNGQLWSWGSNSFGQIAQDLSCKKSLRPMIIEFLQDSRFVDVSAGLRHAAAISSTGIIWVWGDTKKGQVPEAFRETPSRRVFPPVKVTVTKPVEAVYCGAFFTLVTGGGEVYGWGDNCKGQLAQDPASTGPAVASVSRLPVPRIRSLDVGWGHVLTISDGGRVFSWGRGDYGQLGRPCPLSGWDCVPGGVDLSGQPATQLCCGSEHSFAVTEDGSLFAWGWNEHGICAVPEDHPTLSTPSIVTFDSHKKVVFVGAGAGHSFALVRSS